MNDSLDGAGDVTVNSAGSTVFNGAVGATQALNSLTTNAGGTTSINGGTVVTSGAQTFGDAIILGADTTLSSNGGAISFSGTVDGAQALTINTSGTTTFGGAVGSTTQLTSLTTDAGGATAINGGTVATTGAQTFNDAVTLGADTRLSSTGAGELTFTTVDGPHTLSVSTAGALRADGALGGSTPLTALAVRAGGASFGAPNSVGTLAAQIQAGGLNFVNSQALTVGTVDGLSGINTNSASTLLTVGGLLTLAANVFAEGVSLTSIGLVQNTGTTVGAGTGSILVDANDGAIDLAGTLTTTNSSAAAVRIIDASTVRIGDIRTGAGGTVVLGEAGGDALSGAVTQTAGTAINAGTLTGNSGGTVTLTNVGNQIVNLGAFTASRFSLVDLGGLTVTGTINGGAGGVSLSTSGDLIVNADLLAANGPISLIATEAGSDILFASTVNAGTGTVTLTANGAGGTISQTSRDRF